MGGRCNHMHWQFSFAQRVPAQDLRCLQGHGQKGDSDDQLGLHAPTLLIVRSGEDLLESSKQGVRAFRVSPPIRLPYYITPQAHKLSPPFLSTHCCMAIKPTTKQKE